MFYWESYKIDFKSKLILHFIINNSNKIFIQLELHRGLLVLCFIIKTVHKIFDLTAPFL